MISPVTAWMVLLFYGLAMIGLVIWRTTSTQSKAGYLLANRDVGVIRGGLSMAVSWIWAPAIFFCAMKAYLEGLPGIFWFTVPNILCFATFAFVAVRMKQRVPRCYSMPGFVAARFPGSRLAHIAATLIALIVGAEALIFNSLVGGSLLKTIAGIPFEAGVLAMSGTALLYSLWRGFPASVVTDVVQMVIILALSFLFVPWAVGEAGGMESIYEGLGGITGAHNTIFETDIAFSWGIPASITLLCFPFADQMFYQRAFAVRNAAIWRMFIFGGLVFGLVPVTLSLLGFLGANPALNEAIIQNGRDIDPLMINVEVVSHLLPQWTIPGFCVMAICALSSTLDSGYCAISSILIRDVYDRHVNPGAPQDKAIRFGQIGMGLLGLATAMLVLFVPLKAEWIMLIGGAITSSLAVPLVLSVFWEKMTGTALFWAVVIPLTIGVPVAVYANFNALQDLVVFSMLGIIVAAACIAVIASKSGRGAV